MKLFGMRKMYILFKLKNERSKKKVGNKRVSRKFIDKLLM